MVISKANNILRWIFHESLSCFKKRGIPFTKVWIQKFKNFAKGSYHENFMKLHYLLDVEKANDVDIYYDCDDSDYDDEELYDNIYNDIWYVN